MPMNIIITEKLKTFIGASSYKKPPITGPTIIPMEKNDCLKPIIEP
jgi:hypothetical protein